MGRPAYFYEAIMVLPPDNEFFPHGSACFAQEADIERARLHRDERGALFLGFAYGRAIRANPAGGLVTVAAARSGKLATVLAYNSCLNGFGETGIWLDPKGEIASISLTLKPSYYWNPCRKPGLPYHRINPVGHLNSRNRNLEGDIKVFAENFIAKSGSGNSAYFEGRGEQFLEGIILTIIRLDGVLTFKRLFEVLMRIPGGGDKWLDFAFEMSEAGYPISEMVEEEIAAARVNDSGGFRGIVGELLRAIAPLSDPQLMESISPPFDMSLERLCDVEACNLFLMPPVSRLTVWGGILKSFFVGAMAHKERAPSAPRQTWFLDEVALLGAFPMVVKLYTAGAGMGCRPWAFFQSMEQMKALGPGADTIITSSAAVRQYFAVRDDVSAQRLSRQLGMQTLEYDDAPLQMRARFAQDEALRALTHGGDPLDAAIGLSHQRQMEVHRSRQQRWLRNMDEVIFTPNDRQYLFIDGVAHPIYAERAPYYEQRFMAGRYLPNPYHPPIDRVRVKTVFGHAWRRIIRERVPSQYAHIPQFADGYWRYVEGFRP